VRLQGLALFAFIPLVLFLLLRQPLGPGWSVLLGLAIMFGHRFVAAPWAAKYADVRCLWCGRAGVGAPRPISVTAGRRTWHVLACSDAHADRVARFLRFVDRRRLPIAVSIFLPLAWLIVASLAAAAGHPLLPHATSALIFRLVVALTVVSVSFAYTAAPVWIGPFVARRGLELKPAGPPDGRPDNSPLRCPFPLHNLFLLGIGNMLWVFRVVGIWWIVDAAVRFIW
jgi:hypothetical protein